MFLADSWIGLTESLQPRTYFLITNSSLMILLSSSNSSLKGTLIVDSILYLVLLCV